MTIKQIVIQPMYGEIEVYDQDDTTGHITVRRMSQSVPSATVDVVANTLNLKGIFPENTTIAVTCDQHIYNVAIGELENAFNAAQSVAAFIGAQTVAAAPNASAGVSSAGRLDATVHLSADLTLKSVAFNSPRTKTVDPDISAALRGVGLI